MFANEITPDALQKLIDESPKPLVIDFKAEWCGPCQGMASHLNAFAMEKGDAIHVVKVDVDNYPDLAQRFMIRSVPTLIVLMNGQVLGVNAGALTTTQIASFVDSSIKNV